MMNEKDFGIFDWKEVDVAKFLWCLPPRIQKFVPSCYSLPDLFQRPQDLSALLAVEQIAPIFLPSKMQVPMREGETTLPG
jgi:hypothetical protein